MTRIDDIDRRVIAATQAGLPLTLRPYAQIAANLMVIYPNGATAADLQRLPGYAGLPQVTALPGDDERGHLDPLGVRAVRGPGAR